MLGGRFLKKEKPAKRKLVQMLVIVLVVVIVAIAAIQFFRGITGPAVGKINYSPNPGTKTIDGPEEYTRKDSIHGSFAYPSRYRIEAGKDFPPSIYESYSLVSPARPRQPHWNIAITIYKLPVANLNENSSYKIREDDPVTYKKTALELDGKKYIVFKKTDTPEQVAFSQNGLKLAAIAVSGTVSSPAMENDYKYVLASWEWK